MPSRHPIVELPPIQGLNLRDDEHRLLPFTSLSTATNIYLNEDSSIQRMNGYTDVLAADLGTGKVLSHYEWTRYDASTLKIFLYGTSLYRVTGSGDTAAEMLDGLTADRKWRWVPQNDYLWGGNGNDENKVITPTPHHYSKTHHLVTKANATNYATAKTLANEIKIIYAAHRLDSLIVDGADTTTITYNNGTGGSWTHTTGSTGHYLETIETTGVGQNSAEYCQMTFTGTGIRVYVARNDARGQGDVYIDSVQDTTAAHFIGGGVGDTFIEYYALSPTRIDLAYENTGLTYGSHTIKILKKSTKNAASSNYEMAVDCFLIFGNHSPWHNLQDSTNAVSATGCSTDGECNTLLTEIKADYNAHRSQAGVHPVADAYHEVTVADATSEATAYALANQIKAVLNQHMQDAMVLKWGITAPTAAPTSTDGAAGNPGAGVYGICYTYYDAVNNWESAPSPLDSHTCGGSVIIGLSAMQVSTDPKVTHKRIYRTTVGGAIYYYEAQIANDVTTYNCNATDATLAGAAALQTEGQAVPPATSIFTVVGGSIVMAGYLSEPYAIYWTNSGNPMGYISAFNYQWFDVHISALHTLPSGLLVSEYNPPKTWLMPGDSPSTFGSRIVLSEHEGIPCQEALHRDDDTLFCITNFGAKKFDGTRYQDIGQMVNKELMTRNIGDAVVCIDPKNQRVYFITA